MWGGGEGPDNSIFYLLFFINVFHSNSILRKPIVTCDFPGEGGGALDPVSPPLDPRMRSVGSVVGRL